MDNHGFCILCFWSQSLLFSSKHLPCILSMRGTALAAENPVGIKMSLPTPVVPSPPPTPAAPVALRCIAENRIQHSWLPLFTLFPRTEAVYQLTMSWGGHRHGYLQISHWPVSLLKSLFCFFFCPHTIASCLWPLHHPHGLFCLHSSVRQMCCTSCMQGSMLGPRSQK